MKPPIFDYVAPTTLPEAVSLLEENEFDAKILSGGQSLMPLLNMRLARPELLIDLAKVPGLDYVREDGDALEIGGMTRQRTVELASVVQQRHPLLYTAMMNIAHPQNRNQGTIGGSLAHADPAGELPALALALGAQLHASGPDGERTIDAEEFFVTYLTTSLEGGEILTGVRFPLLEPGTGWSFKELARRHGDFAMAGVIALLRVGGDGAFEFARVVVFGVSATAVRALEAENMLVGQRPDAGLFVRAGETVRDSLDEPLSDVHASADFRRSLAGVLTERALAEAAERAASTS